MRLSSKGVYRKGAQAVSKLNRGSIVTQYEKNPIYLDSTSNGDPTQAIYQNAPLPALKYSDYLVAYGYFEKLSKSDNYAVAISSLMVDVAKMKGIEIAELISIIKTDEQYPIDSYQYLNALLSARAQEEFTLSVNNRKSVNYRNISV